MGDVSIINGSEKVDTVNLDEYIKIKALS